MKWNRLLIPLLLLALVLGAAAACGDDDDEEAGVDGDEASCEYEPSNPAVLNGEVEGGPGKTEAGCTITASGLVYYEISPGEGDSPGPADTVVVHYTGWLEADGTKFDSSVDSGQPATFQVGGVIDGFAEGLQLMKPGGTARIIIPPEIGYGAAGAGGGAIPPNSTLIFDLELLEVQ